MDNWIICVFLSSFAGSLLYGVWAAGTRILKKECFVYVLYTGIRFLAAFFLLFLLLGMGLHRYIASRPGTLSWGAYTKTLLAVLKCVYIIWAAGAIWKSVQYISRSFPLWKLKNTCIPCDARTNKLLLDLSQEMRIRRRISIVQSFAIPTAKIRGILRPRIYIPNMEYKEEELQIILKHELVHYLNHDAWARGNMILLDCIYWFNPLMKSIQRDQERWSEYYCDYQVCNRYGVNAESYVRTLVMMAEQLLKWKENMREPVTTDLAFTESGKNLKKRIRRIMSYKGQEKQKKTVLAMLCAGFVLIAGIVALAMETGGERLYHEMVEHTIMDNSAVETTIAEPVLKETKMGFFKSAYLNVVKRDAPAADAASTATFSAAIQDERWKSGGFHASSGQSICVSVAGTPADIFLKVGILEPDGSWRYVYAYGNIAHTFELNQTGTYAIRIENATPVEVEFVGYYLTMSND